MYINTDNCDAELSTISKHGDALHTRNHIHAPQIVNKVENMWWEASHTLNYVVRVSE